MKKSRRSFSAGLDGVSSDNPPLDNLSWVELRSMPFKKIHREMPKFSVLNPCNLTPIILESEIEMVDSILGGSLVNDISTYYGGRKII